MPGDDAPFVEKSHRVVRLKYQPDEEDEEEKHGHAKCAGTIALTLAQIDAGQSQRRHRNGDHETDEHDEGQPLRQIGRKTWSRCGKSDEFL